MTPYTPPTHHASAFHCPNCQAYASQDWYELLGNAASTIRLKGWTVSRCTHCREIVVWLDAKMIHPDKSAAPPPNPDLPADIVADYNEARMIISRSPRGAAALFRLCIQKLCSHLGETGKNINDDIASLVKKGLSPKIQKSLDVVRVIGNESVHPGTVDLRDKPETAVQLSTLINVITEVMISQPKAIDALYAGLPEKKREEIEKRDKGSV